MVKGIIACCVLVLVVVWMITLIIFGGESAFAQATSCTNDKPCSETIEQPTTSNSSPLPRTNCLPEKPCIQTINFQALPCLQGQPCQQRPTIPPKHSSNPPALKSPGNHAKKLVVQ